MAMAACHEVGAVGAAQDAALAAEGLADQKGIGVRVIQAGRVKLHELEVADRGADPVGHGDAVAGRDPRVAGVAVDPACAAGGEDGEGGDEGLDVVVAVVEGVDAEAAAAAVDLGPAEEVDDGVVLVDGDVGVGVGGGEEGALDLGAGHVAVVDDAAARVAAFAAELEGGRLVAADAVEADAVVLGEAADEGGAVLDGVDDHVAVAEASADDEGVLDVLAGSRRRRRRPRSRPGPSGCWRTRRGAW
jgi:hypothetical protein